LSPNRIARAALLGAFAAMSGEAAGDARCPSCGEAEVRHEFDLGCEICAACGHVLSERALTTSVQYDEDGAHGVFLHDGGTRGQHLAAARSGLALAPGSAPGVARAMFRDEQSTHLANINRSVDFAAQQLRLTKDAADDARALVVKASEGRWGEGDWTTLLVGACVYCAARQNTLPIAMRDVAEACQLDVFALGRVYNKLKRLHDISVPPVSVETFVARAAAAVPELTKESIARRNNVSMSKRPDIEPSRDAFLVGVSPETTKSAARSSRRRDGAIAFARKRGEDGPRVFLFGVDADETDFLRRRRKRKRNERWLVWGTSSQGNVSTGDAAYRFQKRGFAREGFSAFGHRREGAFAIRAKARLARRTQPGAFRFRGPRCGRRSVRRVFESRKNSLRGARHALRRAQSVAQPANRARGVREHVRVGETRFSQKFAQVRAKFSAPRRGRARGEQS
jgi:transcription factor IIIB subunit 2